MKMGRRKCLFLTIFFFVGLFTTLSAESTPNSDSSNDQGNVAELVMKVKVEGKVLLRQDMFAPPNWQANSRVLLDYGKHVGFLKEDGSFVVDNVLPGSYIVEVTNVDYIFEPVRIDITSKGKIRARRLNLLQPNAVTTLPYPLQIIARQPAKYFRAREEWRITDVLMNPMVIMLIVAFFMLIVTPKLAAQDPQMQKEMQNVQLPKVDMPDMADMLASFFGGSAKKGNSASLSSSTSKRSAINGGSAQRRNRQ